MRIVDFWAEAHKSMSGSFSNKGANIPMCHTFIITRDVRWQLAYNQRQCYFVALEVVLPVRIHIKIRLMCEFIKCNCNRTYQWWRWSWTVSEINDGGLQLYNTKNRKHIMESRRCCKGTEVMMTITIPKQIIPKGRKGIQFGWRMWWLNLSSQARITGIHSSWEEH